MENHNTTTTGAGETFAHPIPTIHWIGETPWLGCPLDADELTSILWEVREDFIDCPAIDRAEVWIGRDEEGWGYSKIGEEFMHKFPAVIKFYVTRDTDIVDLGRYLVEKLNISLVMARAINQCKGARQLA